MDNWNKKVCKDILQNQNMWVLKIVTWVYLYQCKYIFCHDGKAEVNLLSWNVIRICKVDSGPNPHRQYQWYYDQIEENYIFTKLSFSVWNRNRPWRQTSVFIGNYTAAAILENNDEWAYLKVTSLIEIWHVEKRKMQIKHCNNCKFCPVSLLIVR